MSHNKDTRLVRVKAVCPGMRLFIQHEYCSLFIGLPPGVINFVFGLGPKAGDAIVKHPRVPIVSFTGGTVTAVKLRQAAAPYSKKLSLEVGDTPAINPYMSNGLQLVFNLSIMQ